MFELQCRERGGGKRNVEIGPSRPANDGVLHVTLKPRDVLRASSQERPLDLAAEAFRIVENRCRWLLIQPKRCAIAAFRHADRHEIGGAFTPVVRAQRLSQIEGFDADDGVALRIETDATVKHLDTERVLLQRIAVRRGNTGPGGRATGEDAGGRERQRSTAPFQGQPRQHPRMVSDRSSQPPPARINAV